MRHPSVDPRAGNGVGILLLNRPRTVVHRPISPNPMCGRYALFASLEILAETLGLSPDDPVVEKLAEKGCYNVAPGTEITAITHSDGQPRGKRLHWGLIPPWMSRSKSRPPINARSETIWDKPVFREAACHRRCTVPASGYYEWHAPNGQRRKQPYFFFPRSHDLMFFAGIWENASEASGDHASGCILTRQADPSLAWCHDRMPVILGPEEARRWNDPSTSLSDAKALLTSARAEPIDFHPVSPAVNRAVADGPSLIAPADPAQSLEQPDLPF